MSGYQSYHLKHEIEEYVPVIYEFDKESFRNKKIRFAMIFSGEVVQNWFVIVETWHHLCGSKKRRYLSEFTEAERKVISRYHTKLYRWFLVTGTPREVEMKLSTYQLMCRAANFFASI